MHKKSLLSSFCLINVKKHAILILNLTQFRFKNIYFSNILSENDLYYFILLLMYINLFFKYI